MGIMCRCNIIAISLLCIFMISMWTLIQALTLKVERQLKKRDMGRRCTGADWLVRGAKYHSNWWLRSSVTQLLSEQMWAAHLRLTFTDHWAPSSRDVWSCTRINSLANCFAGVAIWYWRYRDKFPAAKCDLDRHLRSQNHQSTHHFAMLLKQCSPLTFYRVM